MNWRPPTFTFASSAGYELERVSYNFPNSLARKGFVKLLLTSAGIKNASIHKALVDLLDKPIADCSALCIPTAGYGHPYAGPVRAWRLDRKSVV